MSHGRPLPVAATAASYSVVREPGEGSECRYCLAAPTRRGRDPLLQVLCQVTSLATGPAKGAEMLVILRERTVTVLVGGLGGGQLKSASAATEVCKSAPAQTSPRLGREVARVCSGVDARWTRKGTGQRNRQAPLGGRAGCHPVRGRRGRRCPPGGACGRRGGGCRLGARVRGGEVRCGWGYGFTVLRVYGWTVAQCRLEGADDWRGAQPDTPHPYPPGPGSGAPSPHTPGASEGGHLVPHPPSWSSSGPLQSNPARARGLGLRVPGQPGAPWDKPLISKGLSQPHTFPHKLPPFNNLALGHAIVPARWICPSSEVGLGQMIGRFGVGLRPPPHLRRTTSSRREDRQVSSK